jgi:hypothetical protein
MSTPSKSKETAGLTLLIAGTHKHFPNGSLAFGGATYTPPEFVQLVQSLIDLIDGVNAADAAHQAKLNDARARTPALRKAIRAFVAFVRATFGNSPEVLVDFGLTPHKAPAPKTVEEKAAAAAKNLATRKARHTLGKNQKKSVKGTAPASPTASPAPAPKPTSGGTPPLAS